jgi:hypothetical protein
MPYMSINHMAEFNPAGGGIYSIYVPILTFPRIPSRVAMAESTAI